MTVVILTLVIVTVVIVTVVNVTLVKVTGPPAGDDGALRHRPRLRRGQAKEGGQVLPPSHGDQGEGI